jgi:hypothetical protein
MTQNVPVVVASQLPSGSVGIPDAHFSTVPNVAFLVSQAAYFLANSVDAAAAKDPQTHLALAGATGCLGSRFESAGFDLAIVVVLQALGNRLAKSPSMDLHSLLHLHQLFLLHLLTTLPSPPGLHNLLW